MTVLIGGAAIVLAACGATADESGAASDTGAAQSPESSGTTSGDTPDDASGPAAADADRSVEPGAGSRGGVVVEVEQIESSEREDVPSGLDDYPIAVDELPELARLRSGGPPPDGIPAVDSPVFYSAESVDYLGPNDPVVALEIDGDARAYPLEVMVWHEIVNDTVGGVPVAVAYCPLCNSVTVFDRRIEDRVLDFGTSGLLFNSSLVMFDRQTETLWSHFAGRPLYGELGEAELVDYPATIVGFETWRESNPDGLVLSPETGHDRPYGQNPYPGYDDVDREPFLFEGEVDGRYTAMTRVVGVSTGDAEGSDGGAAAALAFPLLDLREAGVMTGDLDGEDVVAFWVPGSSSALDSAIVSEGVDVGATGVFVPAVDGRSLTFESTDGVISDVETGSTWDIFGMATSGELAGSSLEQLVHIDTFWFAWIAFHPDSEVGGEGLDSAG
ncbi:MAG: DUF3179 domain-containing protein [Acidimicrobiia bacterium]|nr:DUF3179 domain-containing protein [Acidimicrobiia bacterium]